jgi:hypothetical protein
MDSSFYFTEFEQLSNGCLTFRLDKTFDTTNLELCLIKGCIYYEELGISEEYVSVFQPQYSTWVQRRLTNVGEILPISGIAERLDETLKDVVKKTTKNKITLKEGVKVKCSSLLARILTGDTTSTEFDMGFIPLDDEEKKKKKKTKKKQEPVYVFLSVDGIQRSLINKRSLPILTSGPITEKVINLDGDMSKMFIQQSIDNLTFQFYDDNLQQLYFTQLRFIAHFCLKQLNK